MPTLRKWSEHADKGWCASDIAWAIDRGWLHEWPIEMDKRGFMRMARDRRAAQDASGRARKVEGPSRQRQP